MSRFTNCHLNGLEPDNLLAFMALLGLLRVLEEVRPSWHPRVSWTIRDPRIRPVLRVNAPVDEDTIVEAVVEGLNKLASYHEFDWVKDIISDPPENVEKIDFTQTQASAILRRVADTANQNRYTADLWSALVSDVATERKKTKVEPTPLDLMAGRQRFLKCLKLVPNNQLGKGKGGKKSMSSQKKCLEEALFSPWRRLDCEDSFRWDPHEDVRYAYRAKDPSEDKETTQYGANRLAAIGLSALTVVPMRRSNEVKLAIIGEEQEDRQGFTIRWPIWQDPTSLAGIRALLGISYTKNHVLLSALGVVQIYQARRIANGYYKNFTRAVAKPVQ